VTGDPSGEEVLIRPVKGPRDPEAAPDLILAMTAPLLELFVRKTGAMEARVSDYGLYRVYQAFREGEGGPRLTLAGPFIGAPQAVMGLEKMIALGAKRVLAAGVCGSLQDGLCVGDMVIPLCAVSEEGTSRHYGSGTSTPPADKGLSASIQKEVERRGLACRSGHVWTTDAPYRETRDKVQAFQARGMLAVEMEMAALLTVARYRGVRFSGLMAVSDELFGPEWRPAFSGKALKRACLDLVEVLLSVVNFRAPGGEAAG